MTFVRKICVFNVDEIDTCCCVDGEKLLERFAVFFNRFTVFVDGRDGFDHFECEAWNIQADRSLEIFLKKHFKQIFIIGK